MSSFPLPFFILTFINFSSASTPTFPLYFCVKISPTIVITPSSVSLIPLTPVTFFPSPPCLRIPPLFSIFSHLFLSFPLSISLSSSLSYHPLLLTFFISINTLPLVALPFLLFLFAHCTAYSYPLGNFSLTLIHPFSSTHVSDRISTSHFLNSF